MSLGTPQIYSLTDPSFNGAISTLIPPIRAQLVAEALAVFVGMSEYFVLFPREYRLWERIIKTRDFRPHVPLWVPIRHALFISSVNLMFRAWDTSMPSNFVCGMMAFQTGMLCIVIISLTSFVLAFQTSNLFSKTIQTKSKASSLLLKAVLAVLVLLHSGVTFTWIVFYYLKQGGWSYDRMTGVCTDPKGLNLAFNEMMETMKPEFYVALIGTILYAVCFGIATYCYVSLRKQSSFSYVQVLRSTPNFGRFYFSLAMIVTLNVVVLIVGAAAAIWFTLAVLSINAALVIRIMLGEEVVKGETTSLTLKEADQNGKSQIVNQHHNNSSEGSELLERNGVKTSGVGSDLETLTLRNGSRSLKDGPMTPNVETTLPIL